MNITFTQEETFILYYVPRPSEGPESEPHYTLESVIRGAWDPREPLVTMNLTAAQVRLCIARIAYAESFPSSQHRGTMELLAKLADLALPLAVEEAVTVGGAA